MTPKRFFSTKERVLILTPLFWEDNFYINMFRIPEVLSRLRQYREILSENSLDIPLWVYGISREMKEVKGVPQPSILNLIVNLGLFDRYLAKQGWPRYLIGRRPLTGLIAGEDTFEQAVLNLTKERPHREASLCLYKINSYINSKTNTSYLTSLKKLGGGDSLEKIMDYLKNRYETESPHLERIVQFLGPNKQGLKRLIESFNLYVQDFLEADEGLRWLWPLWKKSGNPLRKAAIRGV